MVEEKSIEWDDRNHFFAICARAMRRIIIDHVRQGAAYKRGGGVQPATLDTHMLGRDDQAELALAIDQILNRLAEVDEKLVRVVECRFFAGMTEEETAVALGVSVRTVQRLWVRARAWLQKNLS